MIHLITYGNHKYTRQKKALVEKARLSGWFDQVEALGPSDLDKDFTDEFKNILDQDMGAGFWIWKSYMLHQKLKQMQEGDVLVYLDAGCDLNTEGEKRFSEYIDMVKKSEKGILSFELYKHWESPTPLLERHWSNPFLFDYFKITPDDPIRDSPQLMATVIVMKKCNNVATIFDTMMDITHKKPEFFMKCKRHDQSILSIVRKINGTELLPDETYFKKRIPSHPLGWNDPVAKLYPFHARRFRR